MLKQLENPELQDAVRAAKACTSELSGASGRAVLAMAEGVQRLPRQTLTTLWVRMIGMYGHTWSSAFGESPMREEGEDLTVAGDTWARGLAGITPAQLRHGLHATLMSSSEYAPSLPTFRARCFGVPSLARVKTDLFAGTATSWTRGMWQFVDGYRLRQASTDVADRMLREAYELLVDHVVQGGRLPAEPAAKIENDDDEPERKRTPPTPEMVEARKQMLADLITELEQADAAEDGMAADETE